MSFKCTFISFWETIKKFNDVINKYLNMSIY